MDGSFPWHLCATRHHVHENIPLAPRDVTMLGQRFSDANRGNVDELEPAGVNVLRNWELSQPVFEPGVALGSGRYAST
jgi:hypothetical protein